MAEWDSGYVSDIEYIPGFYRDLAPSQIDFVCLLNGVEPPRRSAAFTYCELGCGQGDTAILLAAANPQGTFHAVDFNPAHIARARASADYIGLENITFHEASFEEMAEGALPDLPPFDYVTMHGVYSWVGEEPRRAIRRFLAKAVKPGGAVYVAYNALPGWASMQPLQRLLLEYGRLVPGRSDQRVEQGVRFATALHQAGAAALSDPAMIERLTKGMEHPVHLPYLAHEYLNEGWSAFYHADVARAMGAAKLDFVGCTDIVTNRPDLVFSDEQMALVNGVPDPVLRETFIDYLSGRRFRKDVYVRGARHMPPARREERLRDLHLALAVAPAAASGLGLMPEKGTVLDDAPCHAVFNALAETTRPVRELMALPEVQANGRPLDAATLAMILVGTDRALPVPYPPAGADAGALDTVLRHNGARVGEWAATQRGSVAFATTVGGTGLHTTSADVLLCLGLAAGVQAEPAALAEHVAKHVLKEAPVVAGEPEKLAERAQSRMMLMQGLGMALNHSMPVWRRLGAL